MKLLRQSAWVLVLPCLSPVRDASPHVRRGRVAPAPERTAKEIAQDLARLELIRKQRCVASCSRRLPRSDASLTRCANRADAAAERIAKEGFDRFAPQAPK